MKINIKIMSKDTDTVVKIVLIDEKGRVLMLKRARHLKKYPEKWDLPGGHLKTNESPIKGLEREVKEETGLDIRDPVLVEITKDRKNKKLKETYFYMGKYDSQNIRLSDEHMAYSFIEKKVLKKSDKYQKMAIKALEMQNDKY
jgi:8-oxo-dGTP pyrophosphatase MutT (NUDIX family)